MLPSNPTHAADADAGDCFTLRRGRVNCLPTVINIGVQKAGTGELQTWLSAHPRAIAHGGEVHFFDTLKREPTCDNARSRASLRLRYAKYLWQHRTRSSAQLPSRDELSRGGRWLLFEKTPAYFDMATPAVVMCAVPSAKILLMLRLPVARAVSAYRMCQTEMEADWCKVRRLTAGGHWAPNALHVFDPDAICL
mgnify:CR=1 FL=1